MGIISKHNQQVPLSLFLWFYIALIIKPAFSLEGLGEGMLYLGGQETDNSLGVQGVSLRKGVVLTHYFE